MDDRAISKEWNGGMDLLNPALDWLCTGTVDILDFGCGTGSLLAACAARGVSGKLLDDGLVLWNRETEKWKSDFQTYFEIAACQSLYFPDYEQYNRMFFCVKPKRQ